MRESEIDSRIFALWKDLMKKEFKSEFEIVRRKTNRWM